MWLKRNENEKSKTYFEICHWQYFQSIVNKKKHIIFNDFILVFSYNFSPKLKHCSQFCFTSYIIFIFIIIIFISSFNTFLVLIFILLYLNFIFLFLHLLIFHLFDSLTFFRFSKEIIMDKFFSFGLETVITSQKIFERNRCTNIWLALEM